MRTNRASILILAIWVFSALAVFAVYISRFVNQKILIASRIEGNQKLRMIAGAAINTAISQIKANGYTGAVSYLEKDCIDNPELFKNIKCGDGSFSVFYDIKKYPSSLYETKYGFIDEESKINLNSASEQVLTKLFQVALGLDEAGSNRLANQVIDYKDRDSVTKTGIPESLAYNAGSGGWFKNAKFKFPEELKLLSGLTDEMYEKLKNYVTTFGTGTVNLNTAGFEVLQIAGLDKNLAGKAIEFRNGADGVFGTLDDNIIEDLSIYSGAISENQNLNQDEKKAIDDFIAQGGVSTTSVCVRINSKASLKNKILESSCVYDLRGKIVYYKEMMSTN